VYVVWEFAVTSPLTTPTAPWVQENHGGRIRPPTRQLKGNNLTPFFLYPSEMPELN
jgi:hypothetical protein